LKIPIERRAPNYSEEAKKLIPGLKYSSPHLLGRILREHGCTNAKTKDTHARAWDFPPLAEARAKWDKDMGDEDSHWNDQKDWQYSIPPPDDPDRI
jgi:hypothetical protein